MDFRGDYKTPIEASKPSIAKYTGFTPQAVGKNLLELEREGYVKQKVMGRNVTYICFTEKIFNDYRAKLSENSRLSLNMDQQSKVATPAILDCYTRNLKRILSSPSTPLLYPFYLNASLLDIINHVKQGKAKIMPIKDHPLTAVLKQASQKRKEERASKTLATSVIEKTVSIDIVNPSADPETLFREFQGHFKGGSGRFCYKAQRSFWNLIVQNDLVEEARKTMNFFHGVDKPTAQVSAGNKRMSEAEYVNFLYGESNGVRSRKEKDRREREELDRKIKEQDEMIKNRTPEENARRKEKMEKMRKVLKEVNHR